MKRAVILAILLIIIGVLLILQSVSQESPSVPTANATNTISGTQELVPNEQDLQQLGMASAGTGCRTEEYQTGEYSTLAQYSFCNYTISSLNDTEVVIELKKYTNFEDLNESYQYDSLHLYSAEGLISENVYGDLSRFRVSNEHDYMGHLNEPGIYYYHLWIVKNPYLIHITSKGIVEAEEHIAGIGQRILSKFG